MRRASLVWPLVLAAAALASFPAASANTPRADAAVSGRVVDCHGVPLRGLPLDLVPAADRDTPGGSLKRINGWTSGDGTFEFNQVPPGSYALGFNSTRDWAGRRSLPAAFHPGVVESSLAATIDVTAAQRVQLRDFVVPPEVKMTTVSGTVVDREGAPIGGALVIVSAYVEGQAAKGPTLPTREDGRFVISVVQDARYFLHVSSGIATAGERPLVSNSTFRAFADSPMMTVVLRTVQR